MVVLFFWGGGGYFSIFVVEQGLFSGGAEVTSRELLETSSRRRYLGIYRC